MRLGQHLQFGAQFGDLALISPKLTALSKPKGIWLFE